MPARTARNARPPRPATRDRTPSVPRRAPPTGLAAALVLAAIASTASAATSDLLIVLAADGRTYTAQHALASEGAIVRLALPPDAAVERVRFGGPERATFTEAHRRRPGQVSLWSGSALVRYHHRYGGALVEKRSGRLALRAPSIPERLSVEDGELESSSITWLLPDGFELLSFSGHGGAGRGRWTSGERTLTFEQHGTRPIGLEIVFRPVVAPADPAPSPCAGALLEDDACVADTDADGVPDRRDVCIGWRAPIASSAPAAASLAGATRAEPEPKPEDRFGCGAGTGDGNAPLRLDGVVFPIGQSYLDVNARRLLDRLALALARDGESVHEIAAYTDGAGSTRRNLVLSRQRAGAVRHYLMLRGIGPNRLHAAGRGEAFPIEDERSEAGRRANRRIELRRLARDGPVLPPPPGPGPGPGPELEPTSAPGAELDPAPGGGRGDG